MGPAMRQINDEMRKGATKLDTWLDNPCVGAIPPSATKNFSTLADETAAFLHAHGLSGIDAVGSSMGARLVLELARRGGIVGGVVALNPGGFWQGWERHAFFSSIYLSIRLRRLLRPVLPAVCVNRIGRALLLAQFSARPTKLAPDTVSDELCSYVASPAFDELLAQLAYGEEQQGAPQQHRASARHWLGTARPGLLSAPGQTRAGLVPGCSTALVRSLWPFSTLGCTKGDRTADSERTCRCERQQCSRARTRPS
jgi:pimeloyl-ACP methyl ester carboxylesterase